MKAVKWHVALVLYLLLLPHHSLADYPDDCLGNSQASSPDCSMFPDIGFVGCCDDLGRTIWCENNVLYCIDCANLNPKCGWSYAGFYDCGAIGESDPSGQYPYECSTCDPPCEPGFICIQDACEECLSDCTGKACGSDGCGGSCGECSESTVCLNGACMGEGCFTSYLPGCGGCPCEDCVCAIDFWCCDWEWDSSCVDICIDECGGCANLDNCGDGQCDGLVGETCANCPTDCICAEGEACYNFSCCLPDCSGQECGDDGCGGECGPCPPGEICEDDFCIVPPSCEESGVVHCDETVSGDSAEFNNLLESYSCALYSVLPGPETAFKFQAKDDDVILVTTTGIGFGVNIDLLVSQGACAEAACIHYANNGQLQFEVVAGSTYYFIVDSSTYDAGGSFALSVVCQSTCIPDCDGKKCGDDGCGSTCGQCVGDTFCFENQCIAPNGCIATDSSGCGGCLCEECVCSLDDWCCTFEWDEVCVDICISECGGCPDLENCGDNTCDSDVGENCASCAIDCPCQAEEVCDKGACCEPDCALVECGSDGCGGDCSSCPDGLVCINGECGPNDGCSETTDPGCGGCLCESCVCEVWTECCDFEWDYFCVMWCDSYCGGCGNLENCGDGLCDQLKGESCTNCPSDCTCPAGQSCYYDECCEPFCYDAECGDDGCGGSCGDCPYDKACVYGECVTGAGCIPTYDAGCGGCPCEYCVCALDNYCCDTEWDYICVDICIENCGGCDDDEEPCGNSMCDEDDGENCSSCPMDCACPVTAVCYNAHCCFPDCTGKECGPDFCGGLCGECDSGEFCTFDYECAPESWVEKQPEPTPESTVEEFDSYTLESSGETIDSSVTETAIPFDQQINEIIYPDTNADDLAADLGDNSGPGRKSRGCNTNPAPSGTGIILLLTLLLTVIRRLEGIRA